MRHRQEAIAQELENIRKRQQQLEATNERLQEKAIDIRRSLVDLDLTDVQYQRLKQITEDDIALKDFVAVRTAIVFDFHLKFENKNCYASLSVFTCICFVNV